MIAKCNFVRHNKSALHLRLCFEAENSKFICKLICSCANKKMGPLQSLSCHKKKCPLFSKQEPTVISSKRLQNHDINTTKLNLTEILMKTTVMKIISKKDVINFYSLAEERNQEM